MTCKDCIHYDLCKYNTYQEAKYFGKDKEIYITIDNHTACRFFKGKTDLGEVKHGYWKIVSDISDCVDGECSVCGYTDVFDESGFYNYCPECGAKMDLKEGAEK